MNRQQIDEFTAAVKHHFGDGNAVMNAASFGAMWQEQQNAAEIEELKRALYGIQAQYEAASKDAVNYAAEIARLEAERAELLGCLDTAMTGFLLFDATNTAKAIEGVLKQYDRK